MSEFIADFVAFLRRHGIGPADYAEIKADDQRRRYRVEGDRVGDTAATYQIKVDDWGAIGWAHCFRSGETYKYSSRAKKEWTEEERREWKRRVAEDRRVKKEKEAAEREEAARAAAELWRVSSEADPGHAYLTRKEIEPHGVRQNGDTLVVPMYVRGKMVNAQTIDADGRKLFQRGGEIGGAFYPIADKQDDKSVMLICEGFATGASLRQATGLPVVVAFNAGNLKPAAMEIRKKYPDSRIIIAADNDRWTFANGKAPDGVRRHDVNGDDPRWQEWADAGLLWNPGTEKGVAAAAAVGGFMVCPDVGQLDKQKRTDFNDVRDPDAIRETINAVLDRVASDVPAYMDDLPPMECYEYEFRKPLEAVPSDYDWRADLIMDKKGDMKPSSLKNAMLFIEYHDRYRGVFRYNEFDHKITVCRCPDWEDAADFKVHTLNDVDITECAGSLEQYYLNADRARVHSAISAVASRNRFHPVRSYFDRLEWDGVPRLNTWLRDYLGATQEPEEYLAFIGKKWLTAAVKRVYEPGCKFDHILVMEGKQGKGKSTALRELSTFGDEFPVSYFTDGIDIAAIQNKDTVDLLQGSLVVELAELAGFNKRDDDEIKRWVTLQSDKVRRPYDRTSTTFDRQFVLAATTNSYDYLKDPTGNRRYWPVVTDDIDIERIKQDRKQIWAEAVHEYKGGLYIGPTPEEAALARVQQDKRRHTDSWSDDVTDAIQGLGYGALSVGFTTKDVMRAMGLGLKDRDLRNQRRVSDILRSVGYESVVRRDRHGKNVRLWVAKND